MDSRGCKVWSYITQLLVVQRGGKLLVTVDVSPIGLRKGRAMTPSTRYSVHT